MMSMPALFLGHGSPMNALERNAWSARWEALGASIARPKAVLAVSAHWYVRGSRATAMEAPRTIHDFAGFPPELHRVVYPAPGSPGLAERVRDLLAPTPVEMDRRWGLDHGTWSLLVHMLPRADVPVVQLSLDRTEPAAFHYEVGKRLASLRDEGVLLLGSGNVVHNLHAYAWGRRPVEPFDWAVRFETRVRAHILAGEHEPLVGYETTGPDAALAVPTPDHYLPLLHVLATRRAGEPVTFPVEGIDGGSVSMLGVRVG
jgi:4,5-DOPA dioxygenase extradiol